MAYSSAIRPSVAVLLWFASPVSMALAQDAAFAGSLHNGTTQAAGHRLSCPAQAPAAWGLPLGPLEQATVLSEKAGMAFDEIAPPSLVPDRGFARGKVWHNIWLMDDQPGWVHYVTCQYRGSSRKLQLAADGLRECEQTAAPYDQVHGVANHAVQTLACH